VHVQVVRTLQVLAEIVTAYEGSMQRSTAQQQPNEAAAAGEAAGGVLGDDGLSGVLAAVLEPLMEVIRRSAEALSPDSPARLDDGGRLDPTAYRVSCCVHAWGGGGFSSSAAGLVMGMDP
jgi:hypothetical protein